MGQQVPARVRRPAILLGLLLVSGLFAVSPSRWAHSERAYPDATDFPEGVRHAVTRAIKADIGDLSTLQVFDRRWSTDGDLVAHHESKPENLPATVRKRLAFASSADVPVVNFAAADPVDAKMAPFRAVMSDPEEALPILERGLSVGPLELAAISFREQKCLADAVYFEARGESREGQIAVAQVVLNRVESSSYPNTICGVVYQNQQKFNRCQFSFACDGKAESIADRSAWRRAVDVARSILLSGGKVRIAAVGNATHYHTTAVNPVWAGQLRKVDVIGSHIFYERPRSRG